MATFAPSLAKSSAVASPIPEVPPVMSAILSFRRIEGISPTLSQQAQSSREGYCLAAPRLVNFPSPHGYAVGCILPPLLGCNHFVPLAVYHLPRPSLPLTPP